MLKRAQNVVAQMMRLLRGSKGGWGRADSLYVPVQPPKIWTPL